MSSDNAFVLIFVLDIVVVSYGLFFTIHYGAAWILAVDGVAGAISCAAVILSGLSGKWFWIPVVWFMGILIPIILIIIALMLVAWMAQKEDEELKWEFGH